MEFFSESQRTARKTHICDACTKNIKAGQRYAYMAGNYEGEFFETKQHIECRSAEADMFKEFGLIEDEWVYLHDMQDDAEISFVRKNHPIAYERVKSLYEDLYNRPL